MRKNVISSAIVIYIVAGINLIIGFAFINGEGEFAENAAGIMVIGAIIGALGLGVHLGYSRGCAIAVTCLSVLDTILTIAMYGKVQGWYLIIGGIYAIVATFQIHKAYDEYQATGSYPGIQ